MTEIKRPVRYEVVSDERPNSWRTFYLDATNRHLRPEEIVAALNAQTDAGDVEAWARGVSERLLGGDVANLLREARAERDALAAEAATLRGALGRVKEWLYTSESTQEAIEETETALATPASPAAERVRAVINAAREVIPVASLPSVLRVAQVPMQVIADLDAALRALDGKAGDARCMTPAATRQRSARGPSARLGPSSRSPQRRPLPTDRTVRSGARGTRR